MKIRWSISSATLMIFLASGQTALAFNTAELVENKLALGLGVSLGSGKAPTKSLNKFSSDHVGYSIEMLYDIGKTDLISQNDVFYGSFQYLTFSGSDTSPMVDNSMSGQLFLVGVGLERVIAGKSLYARTGADIGLGKTRAVQLSDGSALASKYGVAVGLNAAAAYRFFDKLEIFSGVGLHTGSFAWSGVNLGAMARF